MSNNIMQRYEGLLTTPEIEILSKKTILIAGCGVGSAIAEEAIRGGFSNFVLVDGDNVEPSNLGRQRYTTCDLGLNKAEALAQHLRLINPEANILACPYHVGLENVESLVSNSDIIVDAIDANSPVAIFLLHKAACAEGKPVVLPVDSGWGAKAFVFSSTSISLQSMLGLDSDFLHNSEESGSKIWEYFYDISPEYVKSVLEKISEGVLKHYPQPSSAASIVAGISVLILKKISLGQSVILAPDCYSYDPEISSQGR